MMVGSAHAQDILPPCRAMSVNNWSDCFGAVAYSNGDVYTGDFKNGKFHGNGTFANVDGFSFTGRYLDGIRNGFGVATFKIWHPSDNHHKFIGIYKNNQRHGQGSLLDVDGKVIISGTWNKDVLISKHPVDIKKLEEIYSVSLDKSHETTAKYQAMQIKAEREKRLRQENLDRIRGIVGNNSQLTDVAPPSPLIFRSFSKSYAGLLRAQIKPNLTYPEGLNGNPRTEVEVNIDQEGNILNRRIVQSSGFNAWDDAVLKAIDMTVVLPKDTDGRVPPKIIFGFRPYD